MTFSVWRAMFPSFAPFRGAYLGKMRKVEEMDGGISIDMKTDRTERGARGLSRRGWQWVQATMRPEGQGGLEATTRLNDENLVEVRADAGDGMVTVVRTTLGEPGATVTVEGAPADEAAA